MMKTNSISEANPKNSCLVCGEETTNLKRGLCSRHYEQFRRKRDSLTQEAAEAWELQLINQGKLLAKQQGKKFGLDDPFAESFNEFVENTPNALRKEGDSVKNLLETARKEVEQHDKKSTRKD